MVYAERRRNQQLYGLPQRIPQGKYTERGMQVEEN